MYKGKKFATEFLRRLPRLDQKLSMHWHDLLSELAPAQVIVTS